MDSARVNEFTFRWRRIIDPRRLNLMGEVEGVFSSQMNLKRTTLSPTLADFLNVPDEDRVRGLVSFSVDCIIERDIFSEFGKGTAISGGNGRRLGLGGLTVISPTTTTSSEKKRYGKRHVST